MTDTDAQRARRRAHNAHALERCNAMGRTAGSILWQPLENRAGKWFMPDGSQLAEAPIEWRSERLSTILDEMDERQAIAAVADPGKTYVETLDVEKWKAETGAQFEDGKARLMSPGLEKAVRAGIERREIAMARIYNEAFTPEPAGNYTLDSEGAFTIDSAGAMRPMAPSTIAARALADMPSSTPSRAEYEAMTRPDPPPSTISLEELEKSIMTDHAPATIEPPEPMLQFFAYTHLPEHLQEISRYFGELANDMVLILPRNPERSAGLRKLLEAKDCAIRAKLYK